MFNRLFSIKFIVFCFSNNKDFLLQFIVFIFNFNVQLTNFKYYVILEDNEKKKDMIRS